MEQDSKPRKIRKSLKYGMIAGDAPIKEKFKIAKRAGFDGVEVDSPADFKPHELFAAVEGWRLPPSAQEPDQRQPHLPGQVHRK